MIFLTNKKSVNFCEVDVKGTYRPHEESLRGQFIHQSSGLIVISFQTIPKVNTVSKNVKMVEAIPDAIFEGLVKNNSSKFSAIVLLFVIFILTKSVYNYTKLEKHISLFEA